LDPLNISGMSGDLAYSQKCFGQSGGQVVHLGFRIILKRHNNPLEPLEEHLKFNEVA
jgi:hypothetical protein